MMEQGIVSAFGPKEEVLRKTVVNHQQITQNKAMGGVR